MVGTGIMVGICTSSYLIEKVENSPYPYPYPVNAGIPRQNGDEFGQYPRGEFICHLYGVLENNFCRLKHGILENKLLILKIEY